MYWETESQAVATTRNKVWLKEDYSLIRPDQTLMQYWGGGAIIGVTRLIDTHTAD